MDEISKGVANTLLRPKKYTKKTSHHQSTGKNITEIEQLVFIILCPWVHLKIFLRVFLNFVDPICFSYLETQKVAFLPSVLQKCAKKKFENIF